MRKRERSISKVLITIKEVIECYSEKLLLEALVEFRNTKDADIQHFLNNEALIYEKRKWCHTYLLIDMDSLLNEQILRIEGYFTLSLKVFTFGTGISNSKKKELSGGLAGKQAVPVFLIGQLGKYIDDYTQKYGQTSADELLTYAIEIVDEIVKKVPCASVVLECKEDRNKLLDIYKSNNFIELQSENGYIQLGRKL